MINLKTQLPNCLSFYPAKQNPIGLVSIPHSGMNIPSDIAPYLTNNQKALNCDLDFMVQENVDIKELNNAGITVIISHIHRTAVDLNREKSIALLNWKENTQGEKIVLGQPDLAEQTKLINKYYLPYYEVLKAAINEQIKTFAPKNKKVSIIDLHSMPSQTTDYHLKQNPNQEKTRPDFCLSDSKGITCDESFISSIKEMLEEKFSKVYVNNPYVGGHVTKWIHQTFDKKVNNIQIEINRHLYMNEEKIELLQLEKRMTIKTHLTNSIIQLFNKFK